MLALPWVRRIKDADRNSNPTQTKPSQASARGPSYHESHVVQSSPVQPSPAARRLRCCEDTKSGPATGKRGGWPRTVWRERERKKWEQNSPPSYNGKFCFFMLILDGYNYRRPSCAVESQGCRLSLRTFPSRGGRRGFAACWRRPLGHVVGGGRRILLLVFVVLYRYSAPFVVQSLFLSRFVARRYGICSFLP